MSFAQAYAKAAVKKGQKVDSSPPQEPTETDPEQVPMMYRAQVQGRCSLQHAGDNQDLEDWTREWVNPQRNGQPYYQRPDPQLGLDGLIYRLSIPFPFRISTNCGQDSILRPVTGRNGVPFIPGSSVKGLFRRLLYSEQVDQNLREKIMDYCGCQDHPGSLRFHGAYPVGDWAGTKEIHRKRNGIRKPATLYRMVDVVHPQQVRQVQGEASPKAIAMISFYKPIMIFEMSSIQPLNLEEWEDIKGLLRRALRQGLGGKTSTGYGLWAIPKDKYALSVYLKGVGVSSLLRSDEPEFRPNLFKATLKGHASRLLAGVCSDKASIDKRVNKLFGHTAAPGNTQIYWESKFLDRDIQGIEETPIYRTRGTLHIDAPQAELEFLSSVTKFAYVMGGFGKSWRRVWHKGEAQWHPGFCSSYKTRAIGCHWESLDVDWVNIHTRENLIDFLTRLHRQCETYLNSLSPQSPMAWREAWNPGRVAVYSSSKLVTQSSVIELFHNETFKTTPAIGGRNPHREHPKEFNPPSFVSSVWHRMLPVEDHQYLEIVTVFHSDRHPWQREGENQLPLFIQALKDKQEDKQLELTWGTEPTY